MSQAVDRGSKYGLRMVDMPYWSFHISAEQAVENAGRFVHEANAEVMKCEGNKHHARNIEAIVRAGIPVQGHIGITPMRMPQLGGFVAQGKTAASAVPRPRRGRPCHARRRLLLDHVRSDDAGSLPNTSPKPCRSRSSASAPATRRTASTSSARTSSTSTRSTPRHSKIYTDLIPIIEDVYTRYMTDVRERTYPGPEHTVYMTPQELEGFAKTVGWSRPPIDAAVEREKAKKAAKSK